MPTTNSEFNDHTTGQTVVSSFADYVKGKIILITGANPGGIGNSTAVALASAQPKLLILAGRDSSKLATTESDIKAVDPSVPCKSLLLDLSTLKSCQEAAQKILEDPKIPQIDVLINNAGVMSIPERQLSVDGYEMQFATNHLGHFMFTNLISPKLEAAAKTAPKFATRVINLSSLAVTYGPVRLTDHNFDKKEADLPEEYHMSKDIRQLFEVAEGLPYTPEAAYGQSKSANVLFSVGLNERLNKSGILSVAVHPGGIHTNLARHSDMDKLMGVMKKFIEANPDFHMKSLEEGCSSTLVAALDPRVDQNDIFWSDCQVVDWAPAYATDPKKAAKLWALSEQLVKKEFKY